MKRNPLICFVLFMLLFFPGFIETSLGKSTTGRDDASGGDILPLMSSIIGPRVIVQLNEQQNTAAVTKGSKQYIIDVSANENAILDEESIDIVKPGRLGQANYPAGYKFSDDLLTFTIKGLDPDQGESVEVALTFPSEYPEKSKIFLAKNGFACFYGAAVNGKQGTMTVTDNAAGDLGDVAGEISITAGPAKPVSSLLLTRNKLVMALPGEWLPQTRELSQTRGLSQTMGLRGVAPQQFYVNTAGNQQIEWTVESNVDWLVVMPVSGKGKGSVQVSVDFTALGPGQYNGQVTVIPGDGSQRQPVDIAFTVFESGQTSPPFGSFDTPPNNSTVRSNVPVTGWVLDDVEVERVEIYRGPGENQVYLGDANLVEGARPDVEALNSAYPHNQTTGWDYTIQTHFFPNNGNGTFTIEAVAYDTEGKQTSLGTRTIICDNANAVKPFGAIDAPAPGGTASGSSYKHIGWILTPQPDIIPVDGSTISVLVDGVNLGHPTYNIPNSNISRMYPGYKNTDGPGLGYILDTTEYDNGVHTIQWTATDSGGDTDGIGSRFFTINND